MAEADLVFVEPLISDHRRASYDWKRLALLSFLTGLGFAFLGSQVSCIQWSSAEHLLILQPGITLARSSMQAVRNRVMKAEEKAATTTATLSHRDSSGTLADTVRAHHSVSRFAAWLGVRAGCRGQPTCMQAVGAFFGQSSSHCKQVADTDASDIDGVELKELAGYDGLLCGTPLWSNDAETGRSRTKWNDYLKDLRNGNIDANGKPVVSPGTGISYTFSKAFCDAITEIHDAFEALGAKMRDYVGSSNSAHDKLESEGDLGFALNMDSRSDKTQDTVSAWLAQLNAEPLPI